MVRRKASSRNSKRQKSKNSTRKRSFAAIIAIIAGIAAIIGLVPPFYDFFEKLVDTFFLPENSLKVSNYNINFGFPIDNQLIPLKYGVNPLSINLKSYNPVESRNSKSNWSTIQSVCLKPDTNCSVFWFPGGSGKPGNMSIDLSNVTVSNSSLKIEQLIITLKDYKKNPSEPLNILYVRPGGGGGGPNTFELNDFPLSASRVNYVSDKKMYQPEKSIGEQVNIAPSCDDSNPECQQSLSVRSGENKQIDFAMQFLDTLPEGWYEFELKFSFAKGGKIFTGRPVYFDIIKPQKIIPWLWITGLNDYPVRSFLEIDELTGAVTSLIPPQSTNNPSGILIFGSEAGINEGEYILDLQNGEIQRAGPVILEQELFYGYAPLRSPNGWKSALLTHNWNSPSWNIDIGIIDYKSHTFIDITPSTLETRELSPSWSPQSDKIAFVQLKKSDDKKTAWSDIYIYDLPTKKTTRLTYSPNTIKSEIVWLNDYEIAYIMPQYPFIDAYSTPDNATTLNSRVGIDIINIRDGNVRVLTDQIVREKSSTRPSVEVPAFYGISDDFGNIFHYDGSFSTLPDNISMDCKFSEGKELRAICDQDKKIKIIDPTTGQSIILLDYSGETDTNYDSYRVGFVKPEGFMIIDKNRGVIHEYNNLGIFVQDWDFPFFMEIPSWYFKDMILIKE